MGAPAKLGQPGQGDWPPATRLMVGGVGALLAFQGARTKGASGRLLQLIGLGVVVRAASNIPAGKLRQLRIRDRLRVEKTLLIRAPTERVWERWSTFESFPEFMAHLGEVRKIDEGRSHWVARGPAAAPVEWDTVVTDFVPGQFIGWSSVEGSPVETSGQVRLRSISGEQTEVDVQLTYQPAGQGLVSLFGSDPKKAVDQDLLRFKSLLEELPSGQSERAVPLEVTPGPKSIGPRKGTRRKKS